MLTAFLCFSLRSFTANSSAFFVSELKAQTQNHKEWLKWACVGLLMCLSISYAMCSNGWISGINFGSQSIFIRLLFTHVGIHSLLSRKNLPNARSNWLENLFRTQACPFAKQIHRTKFAGGCHPNGHYSLCIQDGDKEIWHKLQAPHFNNSKEGGEVKEKWELKASEMNSTCYVELPFELRAQQMEFIGNPPFSLFPLPLSLGSFARALPFT